jgi:hypothetical protein
LIKIVGFCNALMKLIGIHAGWLGLRALCLFALFVFLFIFTVVVQDFQDYICGREHLVCIPSMQICLLFHWD